MASEQRAQGQEESHAGIQRELALLRQEAHSFFFGSKSSRAAGHPEKACGAAGLARRGVTWHRGGDRLGRPCLYGEHRANGADTLPSPARYGIACLKSLEIMAGSAPVTPRVPQLRQRLGCVAKRIGFSLGCSHGICLRPVPEFQCTSTCATGQVCREDVTLNMLKANRSKQKLIQMI